MKTFFFFLICEEKKNKTNSRTGDALGKQKEPFVWVLESRGQKQVYAAKPPPTLLRFEAELT